MAMEVSMLILLPQQQVEVRRVVHLLLDLVRVIMVPLRVGDGV
jgi:hypothetical protein